MVRTVKPGKAGFPSPIGEIIQFGDLVGSGDSPGGGVGGLLGKGSPLDQFDKMISIGDRVVTGLGRIDSIISRFQPIIAKIAPAPMENPYAAREIRTPPVESPPASPASPPAPPAPVVHSKISVQNIAQGLAMLPDNLTVGDLKKELAKRPEEIQKILDAFTGGK